MGLLFIQKNLLHNNEHKTGEFLDPAGEYTSTFVLIIVRRT